MKNHIIKFYSVGNADCSLIKTSNNKTIIVDCQILPVKDDKGNLIHYDVKQDLIKELPKDEFGHPYVDLFVNTHPHEDHILGFGDIFYLGDTSLYNEEKDKDKIVVGELWIAPRCLDNDSNICDSVKQLRKEAKRRRKKYDDDNSYIGGYGNYLRIVGYDEDKEFDSRYWYVPGTLITKVNGSALSYLNVFIHAPFKDDVENCKNEDDKNATSIVLQIGFKFEKEGDVKWRLLMGGDAEHNIWKHVVERNQNDSYLSWDIFLCPHHVSWSFFNEPDNKDEALESSIKILQCRTGQNAYLVASSNEIKDNDKNPPCYQAKQMYLKYLDNEDNFLNTATFNVVDKIQYPTVFHLTEKAITPIKDEMDEAETNEYSKALKNGSLKISATGALSLNSGLAVPANRGFYGGSFRPIREMFIYPKPGKQIASMKQLFPSFVCKAKGDSLIFIGTLRVKDYFPEYKVKIIFEGNSTPKVCIVSPQIVDGAPHVYEEGFLCLYHPSNFHWNADKLLAKTIIPWTASWIYFYEYWLRSGEWLGPEVKH